MIPEETESSQSMDKELPQMSSAAQGQCGTAPEGFLIKQPAWLVTHLYDWMPLLKNNNYR